MRGIVLGVAVACAAALSLAATPAWGGEPEPGWAIYTRAGPTNFPVSTTGADFYYVFARNSGSRPTSGVVTIVDRLPAGVVALDNGGNLSLDAIDVGPGFNEYANIDEQKPVHLPCVAEGPVVTCKDERPVPPGDTLMVFFTVSVSAALKEGEQVVNTATVLGGGAPSATTTLSTTIGSTPAQFGIESMLMEATGLDGLTDTQAGDHPYEFTTTFNLNTAARSAGEPVAVAVDHVKDVVVDLPAGFVGDPQVVQKCSQVAAQAQHSFNACPADSQIGVARLNLSNA